MKCQSLFFGRNKKNIAKCCLLKFLFSILPVKCLDKSMQIHVTYFSTKTNVVHTN